MVPIVEDTCELATTTEPQKEPLHEAHKYNKTPCDDDTPKVAKLSQRVQQQMKKIYKKHAILPEEVDFENAWRVGGGAFCDVYEVSMNNQTLAMKRLSAHKMEFATPKHIATSATDLAREAALLSITEHENIVKMHGISAGTLLEESGEIVLDDEKKAFFILMDRLQMTLKEKIKKWKREQNRSTPPSWRIRRKNQQRQELLFDRLQSALELARGLRYLHEKNIVHCDIKPDNVGFDRNGVVKVFDFGLAAKLKTNDAKIQGTVGSPVYMAPEIHAKQPFGKKVDVFAFALTLWQMCGLEHRPMYEPGCDDRPKMERWWPAELKTLMEKCWSADPEDRPLFDEVVKSMEKILEERTQKSEAR